MSGTPLDLLRAITRDPNYVQRMQESDSSGVSKSWDNRFTHAHMPEYDAVNDRFCKFNLRRRQQGKDLPAPKRSKLAAQMLSRGPKAVWGDLPREPLLPRATLTPLARPAQDRMSPGPGGVPESSLPVPRSGHRPPATAPQQAPPASDRTAPSGFPSGQTVESIFSRSKQRIVKLWDELGVGEAERLQFGQQTMAAPTAESVQLINEEIQRLLDRRAAAVQLEKAIEVREGFLYLLQELADRYATTSMEKDRALRELNALILPFRNASLDVLDGYVRWRDHCHRTLRQAAATVPPYLWKGVSYLHKMCSDTYFLIFARIGQLLDFDLRNNPLLDPRRESDLAATAATGKLPPLRRPKDGTRLADLPKERMERGERLLQEEAARQQALAMARAQGGGEAAAFVEEEAHLANLVREDEEKQSLMVEEESWLNAHRREEVEKGREEKASIRIQTLYRGYTSRRLVGAKTTQHRAAVKIQTLVRQFLAKLHTQSLRKQIRAARRIQALHRGVTTRTTIHHLRYRQNCVVAIQRVYRGHLARKMVDLMRFVRRCAIAIQRVYKGYRVRKAVLHYVNGARWLSATTIQRHWRGYLVRRNPCFNPRKVDKVIKLQAWARGNIDRAMARQLVREKFAAIALQAWWRGTRGRREAQRRRKALLTAGWERQLRRAVAAAVRIQSAWRRHKASMFCRALRSERDVSVAAAAAALLEAEQDSQRIALTQHEHSAVKIQSAFRGFRVRNDFKMVCVLGSVATQIQRVVRGRLGRNRALARRIELLEQLSGLGPASSDVSLIPVPAAEPPSGIPVPPAESPVGSSIPPAEAETQEEHSPPEAANDALTPSDAAHDAPTEANTEIPLEEGVVRKNPPAENLGSISTVDVVEPRPPEVSGPSSDVPSSDPALPESTVEAETPIALTSLPPIGAVVFIASDAAGAGGDNRHNAAATVIGRFWRRVRASARRRHRAQDSALLRKEELRQELRYAVQQLQRWARARLCRLRFLHARNLRRIEVVLKPVRLQEERYAACAIQSMVRRRQRALRQRPPKTAPASQDSKIQEMIFAASLVAQWWLGILQRQRKARARVSDHRDDAVVKYQERDFAASVIQGAVRRSIGARVPSRRVHNATASETAAAALQQERECAAARLQAFATLVGARRAKQRLRARKTARAADDEARALEQEAQFQSAEECELPEDPSIDVVAAAVSPSPQGAHSAINRKHVDRGHPHFQLGDKATEEGHHASLPKDAPAGEELVAEDAALRARVLELEETLRALQSQQAALVEQEVSRRLLAQTPTQQAPEPTKPVPKSLTNPADEASGEAVATMQPTNPVSGVHKETEGTLSDEHSRPAPEVLSTKPATATVEPETASAVQHSPYSLQRSPASTREETPEQPIPAGAEGEALRQPPGPDDAQRVDIEPSERRCDEPNANEADRVAQPATQTSPPVTLVPPASQDQPAPETPPAAPREAEARTEPEPTPPTSPGPCEATLSQCEEQHIQQSGAAAADGGEAEQMEAPTPIPAGDASIPDKATIPREVAAMTIQRVYRGHAGRRAVALAASEDHAAQREAEQFAALHIQCAFRQRRARGMVKRRRGEVAVEQLRRQRDAQAQMEAAQKAVADRQQAVAAAARLHTGNRAAAVIQRAYKCYNARFMLKWKRMERQERRAQKAAAEELQMGKDSVERIQSFSRRMAASQSVRELKKERSQRREQQRNQEERSSDAAVTIQCAWRSANARFEVKCRRQRRDEMEQRLLAKKRLAEEEQLLKIRQEEAESLRQLEEEKASLTMQLAWRSYNARFRKAELLRQKQERDAKEHQQAARIDLIKRVSSGYLARISLRKEQLAVWREELARTAQPAGRGYLGRVEVAQVQSMAHLGRATSSKAIEGALAAPTL